MFSNKRRKEINEQGWLGVGKGESNPWQVRRRIKDNASREIRNLTLLAKKLPDNEFQEVFNKDSLREFFLSLFYSDERYKMDNPSYNADLASEFVSIGVGICSSKYESLNRDSPHTAKPVLEYLQRTIDICNEIGYKTRIEMIEKDANKKNQKYICILEEIGHKNDSNFHDYLVKELKLHNSPFDIIKLRTVKNEINRKVIFIKLQQRETSEHLGIVLLDVSYDKNICKLSYNSYKGIHKEKELIINKSGNNYILLEKNDSNLSGS